MTKESRYLVAYIDILGFKNLADEFFSGKNVESLNILTEALADAKVFAIDYGEDALKVNNLKFTFKQFSDSVYISMPVNDINDTQFIASFGAIINLVRTYQIIMNSNGILIRGGISIGGHIEEQSIVFSEALINAYTLEHEKAIYPRILIDKVILKEIASLLGNNSNLLIPFYYFYGHSIIKDWDDEIFVSPFGLLEEVKYYESLFGKEQLKQHMSNNRVFQEKDIKADTVLERIHEPGREDELLNKILLKIQEKISQPSGLKQDVSIKYKWLEQFIQWNLDPDKSKIKFERYFMEPLPPAPASL